MNFNELEKLTEDEILTLYSDIIELDTNNIISDTGVWVICENGRIGRSSYYYNYAPISYSNGHCWWGNGIAEQEVCGVPYGYSCAVETSSEPHHWIKCENGYYAKASYTCPYYGYYGNGNCWYGNGGAEQSVCGVSYGYTCCFR